jgi:pyruvate/2-oxoglutarate dehydrogenase complex dihydrolipoamide acyltransferase (E2) component
MFLRPATCGKDHNMRKFINGKYVSVEAKKAAATAPVAKTAPVNTAGNKPPAVNVDISRTALALMQEQPAGMDWSGLTGSGTGGQITKPDVQKFLKAKSA